MKGMVISGVLLGAVIGGAGVYAVKSNPAEAATPAKTVAGPEFKTDADKAVYSVAAKSGKQLRQALDDVRRLGVTVSDDFVIQGFKDGLADKIALNDEAAQAAMTAFSTELQALQKADAEKKSAENKAKGDAYLAEFDKKEGAQKTASGLRYKVVQEGDGKTKPTASDSVVVHYTGTLIDGTKFDSSVDRGQPAEFGVGGVIPGWTEALQLMSKGAKYQLVIPSDLAYGPNGAGDKIGPNSVLVFDVELIDVKKAEAAAAK